MDVRVATRLRRIREYENAEMSRKCRGCKKQNPSVRFKYCSNPCRDEAAKKQRATWERNNPRSTYAYRDKQLELPIDTVPT